MNIYVVRRATQGLANYIAKVDKKSQGVVQKNMADSLICVLMIQTLQKKNQNLLIQFSKMLNGSAEILIWSMFFMHQIILI